jgi:hypothetical protein
MTTKEFIDRHAQDWVMDGSNVNHKSGYWICGIKEGNIRINETLEKLLISFGDDYKNYIKTKFFNNFNLAQND